MTDTKPTHRILIPVKAGLVAALAAALAAWLWLGQWGWLGSGLLAVLLLVVACGAGGGR